jgi:hypothetical protein
MVHPGMETRASVHPNTLTVETVCANTTNGVATVNATTVRRLKHVLKSVGNGVGMACVAPWSTVETVLTTVEGHACLLRNNATTTVSATLERWLEAARTVRHARFCLLVTM